MTWTIRNVIVYLLDLGMAVITFFIGLNILFKLFGANAQTPFVSWVIGVSENLTYPFRGIFPNLDLGGSVFDIVSLIALLAYLILFYIAVSIVDSVLRPRAMYHDERHLV